MCHLAAVLRCRSSVVLLFTHYERFQVYVHGLCIGTSSLSADSYAAHTAMAAYTPEGSNGKSTRVPVPYWMRAIFTVTFLVSYVW